ncbi:uncharacterized protein N7496_002115 [Penicillium cataractarum]|uniref:Uncharacterized protein n=1 Tax=Penicillium cataractarum TaxID=2100454 RepID=A0A9W9SJN4_9EURO|nr:uncharacterized protein N7496_002115 [Penicillium cataractarum]KAJ5379687.1 hypothetical protein N7496_002115 [Penicillium cataractarum]
MSRPSSPGSTSRRSSSRLELKLGLGNASQGWNKVLTVFFRIKRICFYPILQTRFEALTTPGLKASDCFRESA